MKAETGGRGRIKEKTAVRGKRSKKKLGVKTEDKKEVEVLKPRQDSGVECRFKEASTRQEANKGYNRGTFKAGYKVETGRKSMGWKGSSVLRLKNWNEV